MPLFPLEDFDHSETAPVKKASAVPANTPALSESDLEAARLSGYETGYQAGWDDASKADEDQRDHISAEFARNIQDLGFTFHEARSHVMKSLEPLLAGMVEKVLPNLVSETIGQAIVEELLPIAADAADAPIQVVIYPDGRETLDALLTQNTSLPLEIIEEDTLAEGQVYLKMGSIEKQIDLTGAIHSIGQAISGLYTINEKAKQNG
ncbi:flagellar biosynthesis protein [Aliiroseovarius sp. KMU-50]|uniref:Flagellar biosynthesis protein n=1 Tax=Aliiroseovarius salicola TaxID=3009082 RepID=A0ABT4VX63_9RHOB|nr:flagellar biosynthesis protein [Aliiroseovarius sp. KMU-50]MDA5092829.1 flagellar biosynthesis protein [Aliiroseovarius sp. KMU-50]